MTIDKMVDSTLLDNNLTSIANSIRNKTGNAEALAFPEGFIEAIMGIESGGNVGFPNGTGWENSNMGRLSTTITGENTVIRGNNMWVATNEAGENVYTSLDGKMWTAHNLNGGSGNLRISDMAYNKGKYVFATYNGIYYSDDCETWTVSNVTSSAHTVMYDKVLERWFAGTEDGVCYSEDGITWTAIEAAMGKTAMIQRIRGRIYCGSADGYFRYSEDGTTWTRINFLFPTAICENDGLMVVVGRKQKLSGIIGIFYSEDGTTWTKTNITSGYFSCVAFGKGVWVVGGIDSGLHYSQDGKEWTQSNITSGDFTKVCYANGVFVAGEATEQVLYYSTDGKQWESSGFNLSTSSNVGDGESPALSYADGLWVACGPGGLAHSIGWE